MIWKWKLNSLGSLQILCVFSPFSLQANPLFTDRENSNIIDDRATNVGKIVKVCVIEWAVESYPRPGWGCLEFEAGSFEPTLSFGNEGGSHGFPAGESLHGHGSMAAVAGVADGESEVVEPVGDCSDDLGNGGFSPSDQFHGGEAFGDQEMLGVYVLYRLEGLHNPSGDGWVWVLSFGEYEDSGGEVVEEMRSAFKSSIFHQVPCISLKNGLC